MSTLIRRIAQLPQVLFAGLLFSAMAHATFEPLQDDDLSGVTGQALFNVAKIASTQDTTLTFYRLMMDTQLELNMNIERMRLGCGGVNDALSGAGGCDIDIENLVLMGRNGLASAGAVGSDFKLKRPYLEFAVKNDGNKTSREVIGINIGAQEADGYMGLGRFNPSCSDPNNIACHTGINSISGYLGTEMSATASGSGTILGFVPITFVGCFGNTSNTSDLCGPGDAFSTAFRGTRMSDIALANKSLKMQVYGGVLNLTAVIDLREALKYMHGTVLANTPDFGLSFQREPLKWPKFNPGSYSVLANTGFWFNLPNIKVLDVASDVGNVGDVTTKLTSGVRIENIDLGQRPPDNCYGTTKFC